MKVKTILITCLLVISGWLGAQAQGKVGYIDESYIVSQMPEYKTIQTEMEAYQKDAEAALKSLKDSYDQKVAKFREESGKPDPIESILASLYKEIQDLEKEITDLQQSLQQEYQAELTKKLTPLTDKMNEQVKQVAVEQGNIYILRREALIYQVEENNLSDVVLKKLGVTPTETVANRGNLKAQNKMGVFNAQAVLTQWSEYKRVQEDLDLYRKKLGEGIQKLQQDYQAKQAPLEDPSLPDARKQAIAKELEAIAKQIQDAQVSAQEQFGKKQQASLEPLLKQVNDAMTTVAQSEGYTYVLRIDASLFEPADKDITNTVMKKLGIDPATADSSNDK